MKLTLSLEVEWNTDSTVRTDLAVARLVQAAIEKALGRVDDLAIGKSLIETVTIPQAGGPDIEIGEVQVDRHDWTECDICGHHRATRTIRHWNVCGDAECGRRAVRG